ncbi:MAG TPA: transcription termination/antitermination NusG family protein, partial [Blastocatellia bacterium]
MNCENTSESLRWYVIRTHPKQEDRANHNLATQGIETLAPKMKRWRRDPFTDEMIRTIRPLFPSYVFARFNINTLFHSIRFTRGVRSIINFGNRPAPVDEEVIELLRSRVDEDGCVRVSEPLSVGDEVKIKDGPLR